MPFMEERLRQARGRTLLPCSGRRREVSAVATGDRSGQGVRHSGPRESLSPEEEVMASCGGFFRRVREAEDLMHLGLECCAATAGGFFPGVSELKARRERLFSVSPGCDLVSEFVKAFHLAAARECLALGDGRTACVMAGPPRTTPVMRSCEFDKSSQPLFQRDRLVSIR